MDLGISSVFVVAAVAGFVEGVRRAFKQDWEGVVVIAGSAGIGALAGAYAIDGLNVPTGVVAGLAASGIITTVQKIGSGSNYPRTPSRPLPR
jgi:hypothetical protein